ncbi:MAG: FKBP-type peptidyl-prolyl cis-trans isomerase [Melioribacteraceae bacterium]|jgi:peptidylprolyl isomerase|nr:FKBP-type peptidyl-prolyl cis-trans isomerase [Melioribacteraceae bacterium]
MTFERHIKIGDIIKIHFTGTLEDGSVFDSSEGKKPLKFKVGNGDVISGIDEAVIGMKLNQKKSIYLNSDKAYGPIEKEFIISIEKEKLPPNLEVQIGYQLQIPNEDGEPFQVRVTKITDNFIELDGNHPLAGKNLMFALQIVEII